MSSARLLGVAAAALLLTACTQTATPAASPSAPGTKPAPIAGPTWRVAELNGAAPVADTAITATFSDDGTLFGTGGCNRYRGTYTVTGDKIAVNDAMAATMMACDPATMTQETAYFAALKAARTFAVTTDKLTLKGEDGKVVTSFTLQKQELAGTAWDVTGFNNGSSAVVSIVNGSKASITFGADGKVSGTGGCNTFSGTFTTTGTKVTMGPLATTMMACESPAGVMEQEAQLIKALGTAATFSIEGDKLEMRTADSAIAATFTKA